MTWSEVEDQLKGSKIAVMPVGSVEQHGHHLGVGADWIQAWEIARRVGEKVGVITLPILPYGVSTHHKEYPGVVTLSFATYQRVISEVLDSLARDGVERVVFINGHGGNNNAIVEAVKDARDRHGMLCAICTWWEILGDEKILGHPAEQHAGYAETSLTLASRPDAVRINRAKLTATRQVDDEIQLVRAGIARFRGGVVRIPLSTIDVSETGSMTEAHPGDCPGTTDYSGVTVALGEDLMVKIVERLSAFLESFKAFKVLPNRRTRSEKTDGSSLKNYVE